MKTEITIHEGHAAVNVKVRASFVDGGTDEQRNAAWDAACYEFWNQLAPEIAHRHGYSGVFGQGRSEGWLVPFYQTTSSGKSKFYGDWPGQGGDHGYPIFPDVDDPKERKRFVAFRKDIETLLKDAPEAFRFYLKEQVKRSA